MSQMHFVIAAYGAGIGAIAAMLLTSLVWMRRAEAQAERLRAERRR